MEDYIVYEGLVNLIREDRTRDFETCYELLIKRNPDWTRKQIKRVYRDGMVYLERKRSNLRWEKAGKAKAGSMPVVPVLVLPELQKNRISKPGGTWSMGLLEYISELDGVKQPWWMLCILDEETGLPLNGTFGLGTISTDDLLSFLEKAAAENGLPKKLKVPGKPALSVRELTRWVWEHRMALHTFSLNKPENQEAINRMEATVLQSLGIEAITSTHGLAEAIERWIAKEVVA